MNDMEVIIVNKLLTNIDNSLDCLLGKREAEQLRVIEVERLSNAVSSYRDFLRTIQERKELGI